MNVWSNYSVEKQILFSTSASLPHLNNSIPNFLFNLCSMLNPLWAIWRNNGYYSMSLVLPSCVGFAIVAWKLHCSKHFDQLRCLVLFLLRSCQAKKAADHGGMCKSITTQATLKSFFFHLCLPGNFLQSRAGKR